MKRTVAIIFICLFTSTDALHASTTTAPTTAPAAFWLDRATADIRSASNAPSDNPWHNPIEPAINLVEVRGNDTDRAILQQVIKSAKPDDHFSPEPLARFSFDLRLAEADALLNDPAAATQQIQDAEKISLSKTEAHWDPPIFAAAWVRIGNIDRAKDLLLKSLSPTDDPTDAFCELAESCHDANNLAVRDQFFNEALARAAAIVDAQRRSSALETVANRQSNLGLFDAAETTAQSIPNDPERFEAYLDIARHSPRKENAADAHKALVQAQTCAARLTTHRLPEYERLVEAAARFNEKEIIDDALKNIDRLVLSPDATKDEKIDAPRIAGLAGDRTRLDQYLPFAEQAISGYEGKENRADGWLRIAAAWALIEQRARCEDAIDQSMQIDRQRDYFSTPEYQLILKAWIDRGHPDIAMQLARRDFIPERHLYLDVLNAQISRSLCDAGQFDAAWNVADQIGSHTWEFDRLRCDSQIAFALEKSGHRPLAVQKIDAISDPWCRATINLQVAARWLEIYANWANHPLPD